MVRTGESNSHGLPRWNLNPVRLPVPPRPHACGYRIAPAARARPATAVLAPDRRRRAPFPPESCLPAAPCPRQCESRCPPGSHTPAGVPLRRESADGPAVRNASRVRRVGSPSTGSLRAGHCHQRILQIPQAQGAFRRSAATSSRSAGDAAERLRTPPPIAARSIARQRKFRAAAKCQPRTATRGIAGWGSATPWRRSAAGVPSPSVNHQRQQRSKKRTHQDSFRLHRKCLEAQKVLTFVSKKAPNAANSAQNRTLRLFRTPSHSSALVWLSYTGLTHPRGKNEESVPKSSRPAATSGALEYFLKRRRRRQAAGPAIAARSVR